MKRGIYLVANLKSQDLCKNLIYSIRNSGCNLPIRLIHFGGDKIVSEFILNQVEFLQVSDFPTEACDFINILKTVLLDCPNGFLYRFLAFFSDWDEFIYSDNDVVALNNWRKLFQFIPNYDLVHADEEYITKGIFNYKEPETVVNLFGAHALETAFTAGHFVSKNKRVLIEDMLKAVAWFKNNPGVPIRHDQSLLHIASLIGNWQILNLCKPPNNWLSSWAGNYKNSLQLIHTLQSSDLRQISHIHYSGGTPHGDLAIQEFLLSDRNNEKRLKKMTMLGLKEIFGFAFFKKQKKRFRRLLAKIK